MEHDKLLRIRESIVSYFKLGEQEPEPEHFLAWVKGLDEQQQERLKGLGFEKGKQLIGFRCYWLEQKGYSLNGFLKKRLSMEDYEYLLFIGSISD